MDQGDGRWLLRPYLRLAFEVTGSTCNCWHCVVSRARHEVDGERVSSGEDEQES